MQFRDRSTKTPPDRRRRDDQSHSAITFSLALLTIAAALVTQTIHGQELPWHARIVQWLQTGSDVLPPVPPVHPVEALYNREAVIPPQCYTRTEGQYNPCYVCHQNARQGSENIMNDGDLQLAYSFSEPGRVNHWQNLFEDRTARIHAISDAEILEWVGTDNYQALAGRLKAAGFRGWIPDLADLGSGRDAFDEQGFARDGSQWVAFNYKPLPSTFWPTNGSFDDVMIRLPEDYRRRQDGRYSRNIYLANLSIAEAVIKGMDRIPTPPIDEREAGEDLDQDGHLDVITRLPVTTSWVGKARGYYLQPHLYPQGTEFLHTVRYVGFDGAGQVAPSRRLKEVRYMRKAFTLSPDAVAEAYRQEGYDKDEGLLPVYIDRGHQGLDNEMGWLVQGFIEDRQGRLRVSTYEENLFCMGCHSSIGATIDKTFSFARKVDGAAGWGYIDLRGMPDAPNRGEAEGEILTYLRRIGGGDEFRSNTEMRQRWFKADGSVDAAKVRAADVYSLVTPSRERALALNKAYRTIVADQDFIHGRDASVRPPANVYAEVGESAPVLPVERFHAWDIRLSWAK